MRQKKRLSWWEPRRYTLRQVVARFMKFFGPKSWLRVIVVVSVIAFAGAFVLRRLIPDLDFDWSDVLRALAISTAVVFFFMAFLALMAWVPRRITLGLRGFKIEAGHGVDVVPFKQIRHVSVQKAVTGAVALVIETDRGKSELGLSTKVNVDVLMRLLSERLEAEWSLVDGVPSLTSSHSQEGHSVRG